jgi:PTH2 family peptidyl-tRNA hydrolase
VILKSGDKVIGDYTAIMMVYKQAIVVRKDLKLGKGKLAAQVAHASLGAMKGANRGVVEKWERGGAKKVVLKVESIRKLKALNKKAKSCRLASFLVSDAGHTQLKRGTITCLGIGPDEEKKIDKVTKELRLL